MRFDWYWDGILGGGPVNLRKFDLNAKHIGTELKTEKQYAYKTMLKHYADIKKRCIDFLNPFVW